ncbi:MFS transporter [Piscibacillus halophilus]|uniref:Predicted arabinose efflux permease, MFS family n=1 Tax=Piscibacillus halophilus TaxID=571933 RepID=A0A1H9F5C6_9BACI|nr:MFS transporter [Piscibacillus halophilus]SEQ33140.1 Predicted arabinose efflux permease, MFS family [Piscibacillus halophilus]
MSELSIWKNDIFLRLFSSYFISVLGRWFDMVAIMILFSYVWKADPLIIALIPVAYAFPHAFLSQFAGILADRFNKVKLMLIADISTAILTFILVLAPGPWTAISIVLVRATLTVIHYPAEQSLIKHVVPKELIVKAITLNGAADQFTKIIGPFVGAAIAAALSAKLCILFNGIAYIVSAIILMTILNKSPETSKGEESTSQEPFWKLWRGGWSYVLNSRILVVSFLFSLLGFMAIQMVDIQFSVLLREIAPNQPSLVGAVISAAGAGALTMIFILNRFKEFKSYGLILGSSLFFIGVGFGGAGFWLNGLPNMLITLLGFTAGIGAGLFTVGQNYILQRETDHTTIGRVSGIFSSLTSLMVLMAPIIGGSLVTIFGVKLVFQMIGITLTIIGVLGILFKNFLWRKPCQEPSPTHLKETI